MLPEDWKKEIDKAVDEASRRANEANKNLYSDYVKTLSAKFDAVVDQLRAYNDKENIERPKKQRRECWTIIALFAAAVGTAMLAVFAAWQAYETRRAFDPIQQSASAAKDSADVARHALIDLRRAFVFLTQIGVLVMADQQTQKVNSWNIGFFWENSGATQTKNLQIKVTCGIFLYNGKPDWSEQFDWNDPEIKNREVEHATRVLGPHQKDQGGLCDIPADKMAEIIASPYPFHMIGMATYNDVFDPGQSPDSEHVTRFCFRGKIAGDPLTIKPGITLSRNLCTGNNNCADDECKRKG
jgi:hypothetical protein